MKIRSGPHMQIPRMGAFEGDGAAVGLSDYAQGRGDLVFVNRPRRATNWPKARYLPMWNR